MKKSFFLLLALLVLRAPRIIAQGDQGKIEKERQELQQEIKQIEGMYNKVKGETKQSISELSLIKRKLDLQNKFMSNISREIRFINDDLYLTNVEIYRLEKQLDTLKDQYAKSIVYTYKNRGNFNFLNFIFSANGFADALKRIAYLRNYRAYREQQVISIQETKKKIEERKAEIIAKKENKNKALEAQEDQAKELEVTRREQNKVVNKLKSQQKDIEKQLQAKRKRFNDIQKQIEAIARRAREEAAREAAARKKEEERLAAANKPVEEKPAVNTPVNKPAEKPAAKTNYLDLTAADVALNDNFEENKGKLPWPVVGSLKVKYGKYEYFLSENSKPLIDYNPGVTFSTPAGANVKAVFKGEVAGVSRLAEEMIVVIRHGKYFTTYSNLSSVSVKKGDIISQGQVIGKAGSDDDTNGGKVDFILMDDSNNVNPEIWLRK